jgi:hypothetical protein
MCSAGKKIGWFTMVGLLLICIAGPEPLRPRTRPCLPPGIPDREYTSGSISRPAEAQSTVGLLLELSAGAVVPDAAKPQIRYFQLATPGLQRDHCSISRVAFFIEEDGRWKLSLRADQNPQFGVRDSGTLFPGPRQRSGDLFTDYLLRNQFFVRVRCLAGVPLAQPLPGFAPAPPVLLRMEPPAFWVQRAVPLEWGAQGADPDLPRYFNLIDRIEVEFFYR